MSCGWVSYTPTAAAARPPAVTGGLTGMTIQGAWSWSMAAAGGLHGGGTATSGCTRCRRTARAVILWPEEPEIGPGPRWSAGSSEAFIADRADEPGSEAGPDRPGAEGEGA